MLQKVSGERVKKRVSSFPPPFILCNGFGLVVSGTERHGYSSLERTLHSLTSLSLHVPQETSETYDTNQDEDTGATLDIRRGHSIKWIKNKTFISVCGSILKTLSVFLEMDLWNIVLISVNYSLATDWHRPVIR